MDTGTALLATAATIAGTAALMLGACARRHGPQLHHGGLQWWALAPCAVAAGAALAALWPDAQVRLLAAMLLLAWPPLTLVGLRRFHARQRLPGHSQLDVALLAAAWAALSLAHWLEPAWLNQAAAAAALILGLHVAAVVVGALGTRVSAGTRMPRAARSSPGAAAVPAGVQGSVQHVVMPAPGSDVDPPAPAPLLVLALTTALAGVGAAWPLLAALGPGPVAGAVSLTDDTLLAQALAAALASVVSAFTVQWLLAERTERQLRDSRRRLRALANQDALTQVPNRRHFRDLASHALRHDTPGSAVLLIFDIDHFKRINDEGGHAAGDRALCLVSSCMVEHLRSVDVAGRHGGDEFVLLLRQAGTAEAMRVASRIVAAIQQRSPALQLPVLSLSFGMVQVGLAEPLDEALRRADQALYEAKRQGRSRAVAAQGDELEPVFSESRRLGLTAI